MRIKTLLKCCILTLAPTGADAQTIERFNSFSYSVNEGLLQSTLGDMAFDKNNFCWISFPNGIQKFDGKNFVTVPVQPGLPDDKFVDFFQCRNGDLILSHSQGISKYEISGNGFIQVYSNTSVKKPVQFLGEDGNTIYFYTETGTITGLNTQTFKLVSETNTNLPNYSLNTDYTPKISNNIINHKVVFQIKSRLYLWDLQKRKLVSRSDSIPSISNYFLSMKTEDEVLYYSYNINNALQLYNFRTMANSILPIIGKDDNLISRSVVYQWQNKTLISFNGNLYQTDSTLQVLRSELVNFQNQPMAEKLVIWGIREDNFGNLYLLTVTGGIKKIIRNNYPLKYYGTEKKDGNNVMSILPDKNNNRILAGTLGNGLLVFDTLQRVVKHIKTLPGEARPFILNTIIKNPEGDYLLFINSEKAVWQLSKNLDKFNRIKFSTSLPAEKSGVQFFSTPLFQNEQEAIVQSQSFLYKINFTANTVTEDEITTSYTMSGLFYKNGIITHANDELIFLVPGTLKELKRITFKNTGHVRCFAKPARPAGGDAAGNIYLGTNKGIFKIDSTGKILLQLKKENGLPDECIYAMVFDDEGFLWCSTNKGVFKVNRDNSILQLKKEDGLQENEFNTNTVAKAADGEIFFGGVNGVSSFYPAAISNFEEKISLLIARIRVNNEEFFKGTAVWNIEKMDLPYHRNSLSFDFVAMANNNPDHYIYQYKMEGMDKEWIQNSGLQTVRYSLPPGEYVFKIYASRFFDKDAKPMKEIRIIINPPFWKTWWFISGLILLTLAGLAYTFNRYNKNKYQKKLAVLENEHRIQLERERISRDLHDSIGAYANAVLYNTELLQKENDPNEKNALMNDLKFASKDIITSLRETVWALKKDNYTAEECWLRIKNFIQALARYYPDKQFKVEGEAVVEKKLHHTKALNVVRIVQEALTNAIKYSGTSNITLTSNSKDGKWELIVQDEGKGFDYESMKQAEQGNGLINMQQRAADSGFDLTITSHPGTGTRIGILI